jgi:hypothetical protein
MAELTRALRTEVQRLRGDSDKPLRVTRRQDGTLALEFDMLRTGDVSLVDDSGSPSVIVSQDLAAQLDGAILHFRSLGEDRYGESGLVLLWPRLGASRTEPRNVTLKATARTPGQALRLPSIHLRRASP